MSMKMGSFMKVEKKLLMIITFIGALVALLLAFYFFTGFQSGIKDLISAIYFALWIAALTGLWLYFIQPYLEGRPKKKDKKETASVTSQSIPVQSPRSNLPLRDRIREYVAERRKEEGLPVPEPLRPSRKEVSAGAGTTSVSSPSSVSVPVSAQSVEVAVDEAGEDEAMIDPVAGESDLPLPDDFDENGVSLPGIDEDDFDSYDETVIDEQPVTETGDLLDFEGELEPDMSDSGLDELPDDDFEETDEIIESDDISVDEHDGGLSDEGLSDFDMPLDESMMDDDISGDDDLIDIEFEDLEPDEI